MSNALHYYGPNGEEDPFLHAGTSDDDQLYQMVLCCLFSDARADDDADIPDGTSNRRGWWGDHYGDEDDRSGSLLWTLDRDTLDEQTALDAKGHAEDALQVLVDDEVVSGFTVTTERGGRNRLSMAIEIQRTGEPPVSIRFDDLWEAISG